LLVTALARRGNRAQALVAYERCRRLLADELGVDPSPETKTAYTALLTADAERTRPRWAAEPRPAHVGRSRVCHPA
jgi:DNA-binding SARP family transcriptional activator